MAQKKKIDKNVVAGEPDSEEEDEEPLGEWLIGTYARWWYGLACLVVDLFVPLEVAHRFPSPLLPIVLIVLYVCLVAAEYVIYRRIWRPEEEDEMEDL